MQIGSTRMLIQGVVTARTGSVIEAEQAGREPMEVLVNNKLVARGEVVVVNEVRHSLDGCGEPQPAHFNQLGCAASFSETAGASEQKVDRSMEIWESVVRMVSALGIVLALILGLLAIVKSRVGQRSFPVGGAPWIKCWAAVRWDRASRSCWLPSPARF